MEEDEKKIINDAFDMASDTLFETRAILAAMKHVNISNMNDKVTAIGVLLEGAYHRLDDIEQNLQDIIPLTMEKCI